LISAVYLALFILSLSGGSPGEANIAELSLLGSGNMQVRTDSKTAADFASAEGATVAYESAYKWGVKDEPESLSSSFLISSASEDGKWKNAYRVKGSGAGHKVDFTATKITGDASFAAELTLSATEAKTPSFDSVIEFDTRDGNATISGRVYNRTAGRPATLQELDAVGKFLLNHHLNVSEPEITPDNWLGFCDSLNRLIDPAIAPGIYIAPVGYELDESGNLVKRE
jgi:hypothetical protein